MQIRITEWDGHSLQDSSFEAQVAIGAGNGMAPATATFIDMGQGDPVLGGKTLSGSSFTFRIQLKGATDSALEDQRDLLSRSARGTL